MLSAQEISDQLNAKKTSGHKQREKMGIKSSDVINSKKESSWADGAEGSLSSTGTYNADSDLAKEYAGLEEDGGSRVDDGEGWREIYRDDSPKDASEYESMVKDYAAKGFDVKAIDMDGDDFTHANFAIKPAGQAESDPRDEGYTQSETLSKAKAGVQAFESVILPNQGDYITGKKTDMNKDYLDAYKLNLARELEPRNADGSIRNSQIEKEKEAVKGDDDMQFA